GRGRGRNGGRNGERGAGTGEPASPSFSALLPVPAPTAAGRPGRIRPLYRRPGGREPNLAPGLLAHLAARLERPVDAVDVLAWTAAVVRRGPDGGCEVPLTASAGVWERGVALGRRLLRLHTRGARCAPGDAGPPRLPGGSRPYVRASLPADRLPERIAYDAEAAALLLDGGRIAPVAPEAWQFRADPGTWEFRAADDPLGAPGGTGVGTASAPGAQGVPSAPGALEQWIAARAAPPSSGPLGALRPAGVPQRWTGELLELITVLTLLARERPERLRLGAELSVAPQVTVDELLRAGVLPAPPPARRPASVLEHPEEGPNGQFALL
ncbi:type ISP restriction/modification enzyme, partial [Streptomyces sp. URMC 123]|uniref:type ISP restriction/modification enzyme n=1 Tax=Streptomyces sp. URMC 123 TaxID=3423403 RepID=UPI003F1E0193